MRTLDRREFLTRMSGLAAAGSVLTTVSVSAAEQTRPLKILFFGGALPEVQKDLAKDYLLKPLQGGANPKKKKDQEDNVVGLEQLAEADLWIGSAHKRTYPNAEQLSHFRKFHEAGKPIVGYRAATHVFQNWLEVDKEVFGFHYRGHHLLGKDKELTVRLAEGANEHPILKGLTPPAPVSGSYGYTEGADDVKVLLHSGMKTDFQPHTWVRENSKTKGRVFYTRYDAKQIASETVVRQIFLRGILWALNRDMNVHRQG
jgi:type 1 glutamine amidotransferase